MPLTNDFALAGSGTYGVYTPNQLFSGEMDIVTGPRTIATGQVLAQFTVMGRRSSDGHLIAHVPTATDGSQNATSILMHAVDTSGTGLNAPAPCEVYLGGCFNPDMLVWHASLTTNIQRSTVFDRTNIVIQKPL